MNHSKKRKQIPVLKLTTKIRKKICLQTVSILKRTCINLFYEKNLLFEWYNLEHKSINKIYLFLSNGGKFKYIVKIWNKFGFNLSMSLTINLKCLPKRVPLRSSIIDGKYKYVHPDHSFKPSRITDPIYSV